MPFSPHPAFVYFDLDDTLLDHHSAQRTALTHLYEHYREAFAGHDLDHVQAVYHTHNVALWTAYAAGEIDKEMLRRRRFEMLIDALGITSLDPIETGDHYMACYADHWRYCAGARDAFLQIAARMPTGILTNGFAEVQHAKLDRFPELRSHSVSVVISEEVGYLKPHPQLFAEATARAGVGPEQILYVGDSYHSDIAGSRKAGWQAAWYTPETTAGGGEEMLRFDDWAALTAALLPR
ncbi:MAG: HAD-IA family hydrolase [Rhodothermales bacterium]